MSVQESTDQSVADTPHAPLLNDDYNVEHAVGDDPHNPPTTPPQLDVPRIDLSLSVDAILDAGSKQHAKLDTLEKLTEENDLLDEKLKEMQERLAAAERRSKELDDKQQH